jgi:chromate transporter
VEDIPWIVRYKQVIVTYFPLGFISFGGPQAHIAILRNHIVVQRKWLDEEQFTDLFAIGQGLPGPTSTQLVMLTALARAGAIGGITAFVLFNIPGLVVLITCGVLISTFVDPNNPLYKSASSGWDAESDLTMKQIGIPLWVGGLIFVIWAVILATTVSIVTKAKNEGRAVNVYLEIFEIKFRIGSLIFGGGQVVLLMLQDEVVPMRMTKDEFLQGIGLAQSMPGPLFNFSGYLGAVYQGVLGGIVAWVGIMGPGVIRIFVSQFCVYFQRCLRMSYWLYFGSNLQAMVPFWVRLRRVKWFKSGLNGVNSTAIARSVTVGG